MTVRKVKDMTPFEALDHVKSIRAGYNACIGGLYKNVAAEHMQNFLEQCIDKWGQRFMECVKRETHEERWGPDSYTRWHGDEGKREIVFREDLGYNPRDSDRRGRTQTRGTGDSS